MENSNFACNPQGRSEGSFSKYASLDDAIDPYHYHFSLLKFGIARATSDAAHEIREDLLDRDEAITLVQRYDHEEPTIETCEVFVDGVVQHLGSISRTKISLAYLLVQDVSRKLGPNS